MCLCQAPLGQQSVPCGASFVSAWNEKRLNQSHAVQVGFVETVLITPLLQLARSTSCSTPVTWAGGFTVACVALGMVSTFLMFRDYRRQKAEAASAFGGINAADEAGGKGGKGGGEGGAGNGLPPSPLPASQQTPLILGGQGATAANYKTV